MTAPVFPASGAPVPQTLPSTGVAKGTKGEAAPLDGTFASLLAAFALGGQVNPALLNGALPQGSAETPGGSAAEASGGLPDMPFLPAAPNPAALVGLADSMQQAVGQGAQAQTPPEASQLFAQMIEAALPASPESAPGNQAVPVEVLEASRTTTAAQPTVPTAAEPVLEAAAQEGQGSLAQALQGLSGSEADADPQPQVTTEAPAPPAPAAAEVAVSAPRAGGEASGGMPDQSVAADGGAPAEGAVQPEAPSGGADPAVVAPGPTPASDGGGSPEPAEPAGLERLTGRYQPQQLVEELARALPEVEEGQYRLTLKLHPESLGEVRLQLHLSGREVYAAMEVANADARQALENRGDQLRQSLSQAGFDLSGFEVSTGQRERSGRDRGDAFGDLPSGYSRPAGRAEQHTAAAISRIRSAGSLTGRLDTKA